ncbi:MAG: helix-turn-helix domain-containing protein, partial [Proteobacteria bacterium]|nr:helix-turn-helix domain-containing protein [Pseudomonadota bacterium]
MKALDEQDHYEVLEVQPGAGYEDIERAYRLTRAAYGDGAMGLYSVFSNEDAAVIRGRIDEAYRVLTDPGDREQYDAELGIKQQEPITPMAVARDFADASISDREEYEREARVAAAEVATAVEVIEDVDADIDEENKSFDGAALRRSRMRRGVELDQIADVTKVTVKYLRYIEDEAFDRLPAEVYVRGFVSAYARAIGLDARRVANTYMERVEAARAPSKRTSRSAPAD